MKKSKIFKKTLAAALTSIILCSTGTARCQTNKKSSKTESIIYLTTMGLAAATIIIGGITGIILSVQTENISDDIAKKEKEIIKLKTDISRLETRIRKSQPSPSVKNLESELEELQNRLESSENELSDLKKAYRDSCDSLYWQQQSNIHLHYVVNMP